MGDSKTKRVKAIVIEAIQARWVNPKVSAWPYIDRLIGALGISERDCVPAIPRFEETKLEEQEGVVDAGKLG